MAESSSAANVRRIRTLRGWSQADLAEALGIAVRSLQAIEAELPEQIRAFTKLLLHGGPFPFLQLRLRRAITGGGVRPGPLSPQAAMNQPSADAGNRREQLRQQWLQQAEAAFDLYFDGGQAEPPVTFTQREDRVCSLTRELAAWLLEQDLAADPAVRPDQARPACCPMTAPSCWQRCAAISRMARSYSSADIGQ